MIPQLFKDRMRAILGAQAEEFLAALDAPRTNAFRLSPIKAGEGILKTLSDYHPERIAHIPYGYRYTGEHIGSTPAHHAGAIYAQDAGAMCAVEALDVREGTRVLDVCAAPGGKCTQIAARIGESGLLISNEYVASRAKTVVENFERLGLRSAMVLNLDTADLSELFDAYFDIVICDAPCSGEGMFRKNEESLLHWSEENIRACAKRQLEILGNIAHTVRAGGQLLYSTCTYAPEENEEVVYAFLREHPEFTLKRLTPAIEAVTAPGLRIGDCDALSYTRRFYPHISEGEGQYIAVMERKNDGALPTIGYKDASKPLSKADEAVLRAFLRQVLSPDVTINARMVGQKLVHVPHAHPVPPRSVFCAGVLLGEIRHGNFFASHQFFSAFGNAFLRKLELYEGDARVGKYLHGEEIEGEIDDGWCVVTYEGCVLGGGKASGGRIKNHYPKGLRK